MRLKMPSRNSTHVQGVGGCLQARQQRRRGKMRRFNYVNTILVLCLVKVACMSERIYPWACCPSLPTTRELSGAYFGNWYLSFTYSLIQERRIKNDYLRTTASGLTKLEQSLNRKAMKTKGCRKTYDRDFKMLNCCQAVFIHWQFGTKPYIGEINTRQH
jgi:hypothetical protein